MSSSAANTLDLSSLEKVLERMPYVQGLASGKDGDIVITCCEHETIDERINLIEAVSREWTNISRIVAELGFGRAIVRSSEDSYCAIDAAAL